MSIHKWPFLRWARLRQDYPQVSGCGVHTVRLAANPALAGSALVYGIDVLEDEEPIPSGPVSLFIDPIGMPLTATSVAGVRRRTYRRTRRRYRVYR